MTRTRLHRAHDRIDAGRLPTLGEYDLIRGLTGIGAYLLHRRSRTLLRDVLTYLVRVTQPLRTEGHIVPGWWTANAPTDTPSPRWPGGHANLGLAHGITGPLALLALTFRAGIAVPGHDTAIDRICHWLDRWQISRGPTARWPEAISAAEHKAGVTRRSRPGRPSWCYGTPGIVRAQQLAAIATDDRARQRRAERALTGCLNDPRQLDQLTDASLCHGWAGLLHTTSRVAADAEDADIFATPRLAYPTLQQQRRPRRDPG